jgi:hypothetical protein
MMIEKRSLGLGLAVVVGVSVVLCTVFLPLARGIVFLIALAVVSIAVLFKIGAFRGLDESMRTATVLFFILKVIMSIIALEATTLIFSGSADSITYNHVGSQIAQAWSQGLPVIRGPFPGDGGIELAVAYLYSTTVINEWIGFLAFSWISGVGTILIWYGASRGWAAENRKKLGLALMFLPSLLFWTSPISKEAIVIFGMGIFICGVSLIFEGERSVAGVGAMALGGAVALTVRPNITLLLVVSAVAGLLIPWSRLVPKRPNPTVRLVAIIMLVVVIIPVIAATRSLLHLSPGQGFVQGGLHALQNENKIGGNSSYSTATPTSLVNVPYAVVSVLLRPFPWEVRTTLQLVSALESMLLAVWSARTLFRWNRRIIRPRVDGMMIMSVVYLFIFCFIFSSLGNFGLLVRERVQVLPFLLIILTSFELVSKPVESTALLSADEVLRR